ncbi:hypothetical protein B0H11DRAFT_2032444 [Mycena galericulata]|nr:hypothetical protein B0H11DRAFT_2032444 [Mycena galericulata]
MATNSVVQCVTPLDNDVGVYPCNVNPCIHFSNSTQVQCYCSGISYLLFAACNACFGHDETWEAYAVTDLKTVVCTGPPQQFPSPLPSGTNAIPSWALAMVTATPTLTNFDLGAASALALSINSTGATASSQSITVLQSQKAPSTSIPGSPPHPTPSPSITGSPPQAAPSPSIPGSEPPAATSPSITTPTKQSLQQPSGHRNSTGAVIGIVIGISAIILLAMLLIWLRRRRHPTVTPFSITSPHSNCSPSTAEYSDSHSPIMRTARGEFLQKELQLHATHGQRVHIQYLGHETPSTGARSDPATPGSSRTALDEGSKSRDPKIVPQMRQTVGLPDVPPPKYSEEI